MTEETTIKAFLLFLNRKKICSVIPFFVWQAGKDDKIPHWTDGKNLFDASELTDMFLKDKSTEKV